MEGNGGGGKNNERGYKWLDMIIIGRLEQLGREVGKIENSGLLGKKLIFL